MRSESDNDLIAGIRACDPLALTALSRGGHVTIFRFALRLLRNEPSADDIVSRLSIDPRRNCDDCRGALEIVFAETQLPQSVSAFVCSRRRSLTALFFS